MKSTFQASLLLLFFSSFFLSACRKAVLIDPSQGGKKWVKIFDDYVVDIFFIDKNNGLIHTRNSLFKSTDGGINWNPTSINMSCNNIGMGSTMNFCVAGQNEVVFSRDGGITSNSFSGDFYLDCFYLDENVCIVSGAEYLWITKDGGKTLSKIFMNTYPEQKKVPLKSISKLSASHFFMVNIDGKLIESTDQGDSWMYKNKQLNDVFTIQFFSDQIGFYSGLSGFKKTTDGGKNWTNMDFNAMDFHFFDSQSAFRSDNSSVYFTGDSGKNWSMVFKSNASIIEMFFLNDKLGWICTSNGVFKLVE